MNQFLRLLESWTTYQDYLWFLAALAWLAVAFGARGRTPAETAASGDHTWLELLAFGAITGAMIELALGAQHLPAPYAKSDFALGYTQALSLAALAWPALERHWPVRTVRLGTLVAAGAFAAARVPWPGLAGGVLAVAAIGAAWSTSRVLFSGKTSHSWEPREQRGLQIGFWLVPLSTVFATHGPVAVALDQPRLTTDFSHLALPAAGLLLAAGVATGLALWRWRLRSLHGEADLNRGLGLLVLWLVAGFAFVVWSGRQARQEFEQGLLRRARTAAALLDPDALRTALGPELTFTSFRLRRDPDGQVVEMARFPHGRHPVFARLRRNLHALGRANTDLSAVFIQVLHGDKIIVPITRRLVPADPEECVVYLPATARDRAQWRAPEAFLDGPVSNVWGTHFYAKAPLLDPGSGAALGWLVLDASSTGWKLSFMQARLQAMALVGIGTGLWGLAIAYRLRRSEGIAATRRAAAAAEADRMKSTFLAKVSHELRTPIQSVIGYCDLLARAPLETEHRGWLAALRTHGDMMLRLVNDLLDLGAMQTGAFRLRPAAVDLAAHARSCLDALRPHAAARGLRLSYELALDVPATAELDPVRLRQILLNLLANAVKFTARGGVHLHVGRRDGELEFVVRDTGPGIPASRRAQLFQPFVRLEGSTGTEGTGLGLALVSGLCSAMGGSVGHTDNPGGGSIFTVRLPLREAPLPRATETTPPARLAYHGLRILLAEDNTLVREWLQILMRKNGADTEAVADGAAAVAAYRARRHDIVILDLSMPFLDGLGAATAIRAAVGPGDANPWLVGLSAHAQPEDEAAAIAAGMDRFLAKPVSEATLDEHLRAAPVFQARHAGARPPEVPDELRRRLLAQFGAETPRVLDDLRHALRSADWPLVRRHSHYLKNSADVLADEPLRAACQALHVWAAQPAEAGRGATLFAAVEAAALALLSTPPVVS
ncbi:MAG: response regulator [Verrucomicrobia bacterium]|nr:response regulator [Verrucomicrobiota bacterium]